MVCIGNLPNNRDNDEQNWIKAASCGSGLCKLMHSQFSYPEPYSLTAFISTDEDPSLRIESFAITNLHGVSTKLN